MASSSMRTRERQIPRSTRSAIAAAAAVVSTNGQIGERAERAGAGEAGGGRSVRSCASISGSAVVLVRSGPYTAADRRVAIRCGGNRHPRRSCRWLFRDLPFDPRRHGAGGRGRQRTNRFYGRTTDDRPAQVRIGSIAIRRVMLAAPTRRIAQDQSAARSNRSASTSGAAQANTRSPSQMPRQTRSSRVSISRYGSSTALSSFNSPRISRDPGNSRASWRAGTAINFRNRQFAQEISRYPAFFPMCSSPQLDQSGSGDQCNQAHPDEAAGNCQRT